MRVLDAAARAEQPESTGHTPVPSKEHTDQTNRPGPLEDPMFAAYIAVTVLAAIVVGYAAYLNFSRNAQVIAVAERLGVPVSWQIPLGTVLAAAAAGLLAGLAVPFIGTAAAAGLVLYFLCALGTHLRAGDRHVGLALVFLSLASAALTVGLAHHGSPWSW
jgi:DoxX-like family